MEKTFCPHCENQASVRYIRKDEVLVVRDAEVPVQSELSVCSSCNKEFATEEQEKANFRKAYDMYRQNKGLLTPPEIKQIREKYGLSQANLSRLLGWGEVTVSRYESGSIQDVAHNDMLVLLQDPRNAWQLLQKNKGYLDQPAAQRLEATLQQLLSEGIPAFIERDLSASLSQMSPCEYNGNRRFDLERFENLVLYALAKLGPTFKTALNKVLWYIDFGYFKRHSVSITGAQYLKLPYGPTPKGYDYLFACMAEKGLVEVKVAQIGKYEGELYTSSVPIKKEIFESKELQYVDKWLRFLDGKTSKQLTDLTHREKAYETPKEKDPISYTLATNLRYEPTELRGNPHHREQS